MASDICAKPQLLRQIATHIFAEDSIDTITLVGTVGSEEEREGTARFVAAMEPGRRLVNHLEVDPRLDPALDPGLQEAADQFSLELEPEDDDEEELTDEDDEESAFPYFPPTDPVIARTTNDFEILGGFASTSMDEQSTVISIDGQVGDEALADAVRQRLREDAATTDLPIIVHVRDGIVYLRGRVPDLVDSDDAVEVASRVHGVDEVIDRLTITALEPTGGSSSRFAIQVLSTHWSSK